MAADHHRDAAIAELAHRHLLRRRLGMDIDKDKVVFAPERVCRELLLHQRERIIKRVHKEPPHQLDDENGLAAVRAEGADAAPRRILGIIGGAEDAAIALKDRHDLLLIEAVIAKHDAIDAGREKLLGDFFGHPEATRRVLAIDDDKIEREPAAYFRQAFNDYVTTWPSNHIAEIKNFHVIPISLCTPAGRSRYAACAVSLSPLPAKASGREATCDAARKGPAGPASKISNRIKEELHQHSRWQVEISVA